MWKEIAKAFAIAQPFWAAREMEVVMSCAVTGVSEAIPTLLSEAITDLFAIPTDMLNMTPAISGGAAARQQPMLYGRPAEFIDLGPVGRWAWWVEINQHNDMAIGTRRYNFIVRAADGSAVDGLPTPPDLVRPTELNIGQEFAISNESTRDVNCPAFIQARSRETCEQIVDSLRDEIYGRCAYEVYAGAFMPLVVLIRERFLSIIDGLERPLATLTCVTQEMLDDNILRTLMPFGATNISITPTTPRDPAERENALRLLGSVVGADRAAKFEETGSVIVKGVSGAEYTLKEGRMTETTAGGDFIPPELLPIEMPDGRIAHQMITPSGRAPRLLCFEIGGQYHPLDKLVAEVLMIQTDEKKYLEIAIVH
jgi:hypothetical protein